jgi:TM2 domain-containing membrane protein YozV
MKSAVKAALLSGFVLPGLGQIYLKRYKRGLTIMILVLVAFGIIVRTVVVSALESLKAIESGGGIADMETVSNLARVDSVHSGINLKLILLFVLCCWLFSVVDAYKIGKKDLPGMSHEKEIPAKADQESQ